MDLNHGPLPYQGSALTELSYSPRPATTRAAIRKITVSATDTLTDLVGLLQGDLDTADQPGRQVVDNRADREQGRDQHHIDTAEQHRVAEHPGRREPLAGVVPVLVLARGDVGHHVLQR